MARIRSVHPGWHTDEDVVECGPWARLLEIGLWTHADDQGVFAWKLKTLKMQVFPADDVDVAALLEELAANGRVKQFSVDGKQYGAIRNFQKHQRPKRPTHLYYLPDALLEYVGAPLDDDVGSLRKQKWTEAGGKCHYCEKEITHYSKRLNSLELDHMVPVSRGGADDESNLVAACRECNRSKGDQTAEEFLSRRERGLSQTRNACVAHPKEEMSAHRSGVEGKVGNNCMGASAPHADEPDPEPKPEPKPVDEAFDRFWIAYPKRHTPSANPRKPAERAFAGAIKRGAKPDDLVAAAKRYGAEMKAAGKAGTEFVCQARTWLNEDRWRDATGPPEANEHPDWPEVRGIIATLTRRGDPRGNDLSRLWQRSPPDAVKMANEIRGAA